MHRFHSDGNEEREHSDKMYQGPMDILSAQTMKGFACHECGNSLEYSKEETKLTFSHRSFKVYISFLSNTHNTFQTSKCSMSKTNAEESLQT